MYFSFFCPPVANVQEFSRLLVVMFAYSPDSGGIGSLLLGTASVCGDLQLKSRNN